MVRTMETEREAVEEKLEEGASAEPATEPAKPLEGRAEEEAEEEAVEVKKPSVEYLAKYDVDNLTAFTVTYTAIGRERDLLRKYEDALVAPLLRNELEKALDTAIEKLENLRYVLRTGRGSLRDALWEACRVDWSRVLLTMRAAREGCVVRIYRVRDRKYKLLMTIKYPPLYVNWW